MTTKQKDAAPSCVVVRTPCCKRVIFTAVNEPHVMDREYYKDFAELIRDGCSVEHMSVEAVRKDNWGCNCTYKFGK